MYSFNTSVKTNQLHSQQTIEYNISLRQINFELFQNSRKFIIEWMKFKCNVCLRHLINMEVMKEYHLWIEITMLHEHFWWPSTHKLTKNCETKIPVSLFVFICTKLFCPKQRNRTWLDELVFYFRNFLLSTSEWRIQTSLMLSFRRNI